MTNTPNHDMLKHHDIRTATALLHWQAGTADTGQNKPLGRGLEAALNASEHVQGEVLAHLQVQRCSVLRQHTTAVFSLYMCHAQMAFAARQKQLLGLYCTYSYVLVC